MITATDFDFTAREALRLLSTDPENWVPDRLGIDHNVTLKCHSNRWQRQW